MEYYGTHCNGRNLSKDCERWVPVNDRSSPRRLNLEGHISFDCLELDQKATNTTLRLYIRERRIIEKRHYWSSGCLSLAEEGEESMTHREYSKQIFNCTRVTSRRRIDWAVQRSLWSILKSTNRKPCPSAPLCIFQSEPSGTERNDLVAKQSGECFWRTPNLR